MKKTQLYILALVSIITFSSCKKDIEPGPAGPAGTDGKPLDEYFKKNGFVKMDIYTKSTTDTDSLILSTEYKYTEDRTDARYSEGEKPEYTILRINPRNLTFVSIYSGKSPTEPLENQNIHFNFSLNDTLGNGKLLSFSTGFTTAGKDLEITDYAFDKATGKIKFKFKGTYDNMDPNRMDLIVKGSTEILLNEEIYLRKGSVID
ncbi:hypothetical protein [Sporocytophaga myxococcoides]|uniref:hypothetical protein n=1 Tax=Sporocytophaga myxococcoides TaxID=153721 RepID=UPI00040035FB|nr:hypothetical protein [Sporocytophaga myxococcoides]